MKVYPKIGQNVTFARADEKGETHVGAGKVQAIFVSGPDRRLMVQVNDGEAAWNVDFAMIDYTPEELEAYTAAVKQVQAITDEGNEKVRAIVAEYNAKVAEVYAPVLGELIEA